MATRTAGIQPGYLPWLGYFDQMLLVDAFLIADEMPFSSSGWVHRNRVKAASGPRWLTLPARPRRDEPIFPLALWLGFPVAEVDAVHQPRGAGGSRYALGALMRINLDLVKSFTTVPLVLLGAVGVASSALGAIGVLFCLWLAPQNWLWPAICLALFAVVGVWVAAGTLGVYLARVYKNVSRTAAFVMRRGPARRATSIANSEETSR